jgi:hypothetical protein
MSAMTSHSFPALSFPCHLQNPGRLLYIGYFFYHHVGRGQARCRRGLGGSDKCSSGRCALLVLRPLLLLNTRQLTPYISSIKSE